jgi:hypothetical protein
VVRRNGYQKTTTCYLTAAMPTVIVTWAQYEHDSTSDGEYQSQNSHDIGKLIKKMRNSCPAFLKECYIGEMLEFM